MYFTHNLLDVNIKDVDNLPCKVFNLLEVFKLENIQNMSKSTWFKASLMMPIAVNETLSYPKYIL